MKTLRALQANVELTQFPDKTMTRLLFVFLLALVACAFAQGHQRPKLSDSFTASASFVEKFGAHQRSLHGTWYFDHIGRQERFDADTTRGKVDLIRIFNTSREYEYMPKNDICKSRSTHAPFYGVFDWLKHAKETGTCTQLNNDGAAAATGVRWQARSFPPFVVLQCLFWRPYLWPTLLDSVLLTHSILPQWVLRNSGKEEVELDLCVSDDGKTPYYVLLKGSTPAGTTCVSLLILFSLHYLTAIDLRGTPSSRRTVPARRPRPPSRFPASARHSSGKRESLNTPF